MLSRGGLLWNWATCLDLVPARSDDLMTPTLKLKRARIIAEYRETVDALYIGHQ